MATVLQMILELGCTRLGVGVLALVHPSWFTQQCCMKMTGINRDSGKIQGVVEVCLS